MAASVGGLEQLVGNSLSLNIKDTYSGSKITNWQARGFSAASILGGRSALCQPSSKFSRKGRLSRNLQATLAALPLRNSGRYKRRVASRSSGGQCRSQQNDAASETTDTAEVPEIEFEDESSPSTSGSNDAAEFPAPSKKLNQRLALASVAVAVGMFAVTRGAGAGPDLNQLAAGAMQYDAAIANGRPTVVEFYADWCVVCREMAKEVYLAEQNYKDKVNFVLLNIDNKRWAEEVEEYGVGGIPHFVFLDSDGVEEGSAVGKLPRSILEENLAAMARGDKLLPHSGVVGRISEPGQRPAGLTAPALVGPRTHG